MLIRSMAPKVIAADEIGNAQDVEAIRYAVCSGVKGIFTAHGASLEDLRLNPAIYQLLQTCLFEKIIFLSDKKQEKGEVDRVYTLQKLEKQYISIE